LDELLEDSIVRAIRRLHCEFYVLVFAVLVVFLILLFLYYPKMSSLSPPECPEGQVGTPPDCETPPGILPPPENGDEPPENGGDDAANGEMNDGPENNYPIYVNNFS
jgi:hypothetical protein